MQAEARPDPWILRPRPNPRAALRLFCFPYAGGGASIYRTWPAYLHADIEVVAVQLPGREERMCEPAYSDASELCLRLTRDEVLADAEMMALMLPLLRSDLMICESYRYASAEPLPCPISVFGGILDKVVRRPDLLLWDAETCGGFQARMYPGGHFFFDDLKQRVLQAVTDDLAAHRARPVAATSMYQGGAPS
jgi:surfactin synthase thioesterase subunit